MVMTKDMLEPEEIDEDLRYIKHYSNGKRDIKYVVLHCLSVSIKGLCKNENGKNIPAFKTEKDAVDFMENPSVKVSADIVIKQNGDIVRYVPEGKPPLDSYRTWHARGCNSDSIGIELIRNADAAIDEQYTEEQYHVLGEFLRDYGKPYTFHKTTDPERKTDPDHFDNDKLDSIIGGVTLLDEI